MDKQTIYKNSGGYYKIHADELLAKGYTVTQETPEYAIFELKDLVVGEQGESDSK